MSIFSHQTQAIKGTRSNVRSIHSLELQPAMMPNGAGTILKKKKYFKFTILQNTIMIRTFSSEAEGHDSRSNSNSVSYVENFQSRYCVFLFEILCNEEDTIVWCHPESTDHGGCIRTRKKTFASPNDKYLNQLIFPKVDL